MSTLPTFFFQAALTDTAHSVAERFGLNGWLFLSQAFSFSIVCLLLYKFAYQPILNVLETRRQKIEQGLADAARIREELAATERRQAEILAAANAQAQKMIEEARAAAKTVGERETQRAISEAERIISQAREATQLDHARMMAELKREVARLVIDTTSRVSGKVLTQDDQRRLSEEASREIAA
jgi:F-type H+-transporting ATPase subunit b